MSFSRGFKIGLFLLLLGVVLVQASRSLTLCGGILLTMEKPAVELETPLHPPTAEAGATPPGTTTDHISPRTLPLPLGASGSSFVVSGSASLPVPISD